MRQASRVRSGWTSALRSLESFGDGLSKEAIRCPHATYEAVATIYPTAWVNERLAKPSRDHERGLLLAVYAVRVQRMRVWVALQVDAMS